MSGGGRKPLSPEDEAFLRTYDASAFERVSVAVDVCLLTIEAGALTVHVVERTEPPYQGCLALPGGFVRPKESVDDAARRVVREKAGLDRVFLEQLFTFGEPDRDPRTRVISVAYFALLGRREEPLPPALRPVPMRGHPALAFDHDRIVETALTRIQRRVEWTPIAFELMAPEFTLSELQAVYEIILERRLAKPAFRRKILAAGLVRPTGRQKRGGYRPAALYRFIDAR